MPRTQKQQSWLCVKSAAVQQGLLGLEQCHTEAQSQLRLGTTPTKATKPSQNLECCRTWNSPISSLLRPAQVCSIPELLSPQGHKEFYTRRNLCIPLPSQPSQYPHHPLRLLSQPSSPWPQGLHQEVEERKPHTGLLLHTWTQELLQIHKLNSSQEGIPQVEGLL